MELEILRKIYITLDSDNVVIDIFSDVFKQPQETDILLEQGNEDYHAHVQLKYRLVDEQGKYNYKYVDNILIERTNVEKIDIEEIKQNKISEISSICEDKIINEFYSSCLGTNKRFDCTLTDQTNIMGLVAKAQMILSNITTDTTLDWKASGEPLCYAWTPMQVMILGSDLFTHKTEKIKVFEQLRVYINEQTDAKVVNAITWETVIPTT